MSESLFSSEKPIVKKTKSLAMRDVESSFNQNILDFKDQLLQEIDISLKMPGNPIMNLITNFQNIMLSLIHEFDEKVQF